MIGVALIGLDHQTVARPNSFCWLFLEGFIGTQSDPFVYLLTMAVFTVKQQNQAVPNICSQSLTYLLSYSSQENSLILVCVCVCVCVRACICCSVVSDSLQPHGLQPAWLICLWDADPWLILIRPHSWSWSSFKPFQTLKLPQHRESGYRRENPTPLSVDQ